MKIPRRRFLPLLAFFALLLPLARAEEKPHNFAKWDAELAAFAAKDLESPPPKHAIVFVGSSSIRKWTSVAKDFPEHQVINRGFGGSEMADSAHFFDQLVLAYEPRMVILYAGGNDINAGRSPEEVFASFKLFAANLREKLPDTELAYISIAGNPARWAQVEKVKAANKMIQDYIKDQPHTKFIDVFPKMLGEDGVPRPEIFVDDKLHMNAEGYKLWTEIVRPFLPPPDLVKSTDK